MNKFTFDSLFFFYFIVRENKFLHRNCAFDGYRSRCWATPWSIKFNLINSVLRLIRECGFFFLSYKWRKSKRKRIENVIWIVGFWKRRRYWERRSNPTTATTTTTTSTSIFGDKEKKSSIRCVRIYSVQIWSHWETVNAGVPSQKLLNSIYFPLVDTETERKKRGRIILF